MKPSKKVEQLNSGEKPVLAAGKGPETTAVVKAFTVVRKDGGWRQVTYEIHGDGTATISSQSEPDLKILAIEAFKIAAHKWWTSL